MATSTPLLQADTIVPEHSPHLATPTESTEMPSDRPNIPDPPPAVAPPPSCSTQQQGLPHQHPGSLSWKLWCDGEALARKSLHHPFVQGLATGELPRPAFQHYLLQDFIYLHHYAKAYELALLKCEGHPREVHDSILRLLAGIKLGLDLHRAYAASWGVELEGVPPGPTTLAYTDFLMEVAHSDKGVEAVFAAMAPCARLYGFLGCQLAESHPGWRSSPYARWIETYSGEDFLALAALKERLLDGMEGRTEYGVLSQLYNKAMQLELEFFDAQPWQ